MLRKLGDPWAQVVGGGWPWWVTRGVPDPVLLDVCRAWVGCWDKLMSSKTASKPSPVLGCGLCPLGFKSAWGSWLPPGTSGQGRWAKGLRYEEKGMATHSSILAWRIPWTEEPGGLQLMQLHRFRLG